jgi:hypothetical protein
MKKSFESSLHDEPNPGSGGSIARVPAGSPIHRTPEDMVRLRALARRPGEEIDFSDIPRLTRDEYEEALRMIEQRKKLQKAS